MTVFRAPIFAKLPRAIRVLTMLILTATSLFTCLNPLHAAEETVPPADLLQLQKELVATLDTRLKRMRTERRVGQRTDLEITPRAGRLLHGIGDSLRNGSAGRSHENGERRTDIAD
jgi:hypothetical protein